MGVRVELEAAGIDDVLQGLSSDPFGGGFPVNVGLRVPSFRANDTTRFMFCLARRVLDRPTRIIGIRTGYTLGSVVVITPGGEGPAVTRPTELPVTTPTYMPPDGNVSFHLVLEPNTDTVPVRPVTDNVNLALQESLSPALLYETIGWSAAQSPYYWLNMNAYTPPDPIDWEPVGGLGTIRGGAFPYFTAQAWRSLDIPIRLHGEYTVGLYASVLQSAGILPINGVGTSFPSPEENWIGQITALSGSTAPIIWRVLGALIFEDEDAIQSCPPVPGQYQREAP